MTRWPSTGSARREDAIPMDTLPTSRPTSIASTNAYPPSYHTRADPPPRYLPTTRLASPRPQPPRQRSCARRFGSFLLNVLSLLGWTYFILLPGPELTLGIFTFAWFITKCLMHPFTDPFWIDPGQPARDILPSLGTSSVLLLLIWKSRYSERERRDGRLREYERDREDGRAIRAGEKEQYERDEEDRAREVLSRIGLTIMAVLVALVWVAGLKYLRNQASVPDDGGGGAGVGVGGNGTGGWNLTMPGNGTAIANGTVGANYTSFAEYLNMTGEERMERLRKMYGGIRWSA